MNDTGDIRLPRDSGAENDPQQSNSLLSWFRMILRGRDDDSVWDEIKKLIDEKRENITPEERKLLANVLKLHEKTVADAMMPRVDIVALEVNTPFQEAVRFMAAEGHSRLPVYRETLDNVVGMVHVKDMLSCLVEGRPCKLEDLARKMPIVAPGKKVLELLRQMRQKRQHMALVVDEYGGIDGLVTMEDLVEEIVGEIEDEYDEEDSLILTPRPDGTMIVDARTTIEEFEARLGPVLKDNERAEVDTVGGLALFLAGRMPQRGDVLKHGSGLEFEVIDADSRRVRHLKVRHLNALALPPVKKA